jgi:phospholipid/cholesterol/gamma-HCH transport system ATP-binding protein
LDELVLSLRDQFDVAILIVTHELSSIQMIADRAVMLDAGTVLAAGTLEEVKNTEHPQIRAFFDRKPKPVTIQRGLIDTLIVDGAKYGKDPT